VVIVGHFLPSAVGTGGHHRSYQIAWDTRRVAGDRVVSLTWPMVKELRELNAALVGSVADDNVRLDDATLPYTIDRLRRAFRKVRGNWFQLLSPTRVVLSPWGEASLVDRYRALVAAARDRVVCIIEHPCFQALARLNRELGIPTVALFHNLESLDVGGPLDFNRRWTTWARIGDLVTELGVLRLCDERLCISAVEAGFVNGLGIPAKHYPYRPVGEVAAWLDRVRAQRAARTASPSRRTQLVMLGSAVHPSTAKGFQWFVDGVARGGLPNGVEIDVVGAGTDRLSIGTNNSGPIRFRGWLTAGELESLLVSADAAVLPQREGFGAVTRLPELSAAGIPVIASEHAAFAAGPVPGLRLVDDEWSSWRRAIDDVQNGRLRYVAEARQDEDSVLQRTLGRMMGADV